MPFWGTPTILGNSDHHASAERRAFITKRNQLELHLGVVLYGSCTFASLNSTLEHDEDDDAIRGLELSLGMASFERRKCCEVVQHLRPSNAVSSECGSVSSSRTWQLCALAFTYRSHVDMLSSRSKPVGIRALRALKEARL